MKLVRDGFISCESVAQFKAKKSPSPIIKVVNVSTQRKSTRSTDFNQANWGSATTGYIQSIKSLTANKFDAIITEAMKASKLTQRNKAATMLSDNEELDERAVLCDDDSDTDFE